MKKEAEYNRNTILIYNRKIGRLFCIDAELFLFPIWLSQTQILADDSQTV